MIVAVPSMGRAGKTTTDKTIPSTVFYVPAREVEQYKRSGVQSVIGVPDEIKGITKTRNWILDSCGDPRVVMIDDDVRVCGFVRLDPTKNKHLKLTAEQWISEMETLFDVAQGLGYRIWGVATVGASWGVRPWTPFLFQSYVTASFMGIVNDGRTRFDESFKVKEDYELCLRCITQDGGVLAARYLYWENDHWHTAGGCATYRTPEIELDAIKRLQEMYPALVRQVTRGGSEFSIDIL